MANFSCGEAGGHYEGGILVVEDEPLVALYLEDTLETLGHKCCGVASTADEALSRAESERPHLAFVDIGLRGSRDGIALASELTRLGIAVVFLTGSTDPETQRRAQAVRPYGVLSKPCVEQEIASMLESARSLLQQ